MRQLGVLLESYFIHFSILTLGMFLLYLYIISTRDIGLALSTSKLLPLV